MKLLKGFKSFLYKCDFFYSTQLLRYKTEPEYRTLFGGILSLLIIIGLVVTFYNKLIDTINKVVITSVSSNLNAANPAAFTISTFVEGNFMFGVQIWHHDLNTGPRYFDMVLTSVQLDTGQRRDSSKQYPLEPCTLDHWQGFPQVQKDYERLKMNYWLCLPRNMKYNIQGKYASEFSQTLEVAVVKCTNESNPERPCANESEIQAYFQQQQSFFFTIYFINPLINPTSEEYITHYLEDNNYIIFTKNLGAEGVLFMQEYSISTDESILPFAVTHEQTGGIVTQFALKNPYQVTGDVYCSFAFFKSGISRSYQRNFQKLDEILSYIGGLFGTIAIALFLVNAYNGNSFQITLGAYLFHSKDQKQGNKLKKYNFLSYMLQALYSFLNLLGCPPKWKTIKEYYICRQEMVKQLDVLYILKRVFFLERTINILFEEHQLKGIHLQQNMTLEQAKRNRKNFKLKRQLLNKAATVKKKLKSDESVVNVTEQLINFPDAKIYQTQQYNSTGQKPINFHQMSEKIAAKDVNIFVERSTQSQTQQTVNHFISQDSESSESENDDDLGYEMKKLRAEAQKSDSISSKIWRNIDRRMLGEMPYIVPKERGFATTQSQISQETSEIAAKTKILKISPFGQYENRDSYGSEPKDSTTKIGKNKYERKEFYKEEAYYEDWKRGSQQPQNVVLENELPE